MLCYDAHLCNLPVHLFYVLEEIIFGGAEGRLIPGIVRHGGGDGLHLRSVGGLLREKDESGSAACCVDFPISLKTYTDTYKHTSFLQLESSFLSILFSDHFLKIISLLKHIKLQS